MWSAFERLSCLILSASPSASLSSACASALALRADGPAAFAGSFFSNDKFDRDAILHPNSGSLNDAIPNSSQYLTKLNQRLGETCDAVGVAARKRRRNDATSPGKCIGEGSTPLQQVSAAGGRTPLADRSGLAMHPQSPVPAVPSRSPGTTSATVPATSLFQTPVELLSRLSPRRLLSYPGSPVAPSPNGRHCSNTTFINSDIVDSADIEASPASRDQQESSLMQDKVLVEEDACRRVWSLASLLRALGEGLHALHSFDCSLALESLQRLPAKHQKSGFVQNLMGRCHFEAADYRQATIVYARCCEEHQLHKPLGLEYYSTALWHLRESVNLACLAKKVLDWDKSLPAAWCVVGNCFSHQHDHDQAIRCFRRAVQLDPLLAYAYTLIGHEFVELEKLDKAIEMYEKALCIDVRHYNAWWGLGNLYIRQEEYQNARYHFQKAVDINGGNALLRISLGEACVALGEPVKALEIFSAASRLKNGNAAACYQMGCVLSSMGRYKEAIEELQSAQNAAPREPKIKYQLGRAYAHLGDTQRATMHFSMAMDLCGGRDSKDHQVILTAQAQLSDRGNGGSTSQVQDETDLGTPVSSNRRRRDDSS